MEFQSSNISAATRAAFDKAAEDGGRFDYMSNNSVNYAGAKKLTLVAGVATPCRVELNGQVRHFAKFSIKLDGRTALEAGRQLFNPTYVVIDDATAAKATDYAIPRGTRTVTQKAIAYDNMPSGFTLNRRFPTLEHKLDGNVPFVAADKEIDLKTLPLVGVRQFIADPADPSKQIVVYRLVKDYVVEK